MKKVLMVLGVLLALAVGVFVVKTVIDIGKEKALIEEFTEIVEMTEEKNPDFDAIRKRTAKTISSGDYKKVEIAGKEYVKDVADLVEEMTKTLSDEGFANLLTVDNYKKDGPKFVKSRAFVKETKAKIDGFKASYEELLSEEKIMSYIEDDKLDSYYEDFYRDKIIGEINSDEKAAIDESIAELMAVLDGAVKIYDFLEANAGNWTTTNDNIVFANQSLIDQYNKLVDDLN